MAKLDFPIGKLSADEMNMLAHDLEFMLYVPEGYQPHEFMEDSTRTVLEGVKDIAIKLLTDAGYEYVPESQEVTEHGEVIPDGR